MKQGCVRSCPPRLRFLHCLPNCEIYEGDLHKDKKHMHESCIVTYLVTEREKKTCVFCSLTVAVAIVADSNGASEEAGGPAEVAGAGVSDVVIAADCLLG